MRGSQKNDPGNSRKKGTCPSHKGGVKLLGGRRGKNRRERVEQGGKTKRKTKRKTERSETEKNREERKSTENRKGKRGIEMV